MLSFSLYLLCTLNVVCTMEISFTGKRALVTGASRGKSPLRLYLILFQLHYISGIGREIVKNLVKCGAQVIAVSRNKSQLGKQIVNKSQDNNFLVINIFL